MMTIIYIFYVEDFSTYDFNLDSHKQPYIYYAFKNYCTLFDIHISRICQVSYPILFSK